MSKAFTEVTIKLTDQQKHELRQGYYPVRDDIARQILEILSTDDQPKGEKHGHQNRN
jgi:hypothetical protein